MFALQQGFWPLPAMCAVRSRRGTKTSPVAESRPACTPARCAIQEVIAMFEYRGLLDRPYRDAFGWEGMFRGFDQLFRELERDPGLTSFGAVPAEVTEEEARFVVKLEVPGIADKDLHIEFHDGVLTVSAERAVEVPAGYKALRRERGATRFSRSYGFGDHADPEKTTAELKDGVLTVGIGKSQKTQKKSIPVRVS
jgi:HSP20 family protein